MVQTIMTLEELRALKEEIEVLAQRHGARNLRVFGSTVHGDSRPDSDVDFLVEMDGDRSLMDRVALIQSLEDLLGCKVDLATERGLHRTIGEKVLREAVPL